MEFRNRVNGTPGPAGSARAVDVIGAPTGKSASLSVGSFAIVMSPELSIRASSIVSSPVAAKRSGAVSVDEAHPFRTVPLIVTAVSPTMSSARQSAVMVPAISTRPVACSCRSLVTVTVTPAGTDIAPTTSTPASVVSLVMISGRGSTTSVATPPAVTVAMAGSLDVHSTVAPTTGAAPASTTDAVNARVAPTSTVSVDGLIVTALGV